MFEIIGDEITCFPLKAHRGYVYEFSNLSGVSVNKPALVISDEMRRSNKYISILLLTENSGGHEDVVPVMVNGKELYAHCGLVTFCQRLQLGDHITTLDDETMKTIDRAIKWQLGLADKNGPDYEELYRNLVYTLAHPGSGGQEVGGDEDKDQ